MKGCLRSLALVAVFLGWTTGNGFASAMNIYIAQNPVGSANGIDCADAYGVNFFNSSGDWGVGTGQIGPGTTVHLCGTFTGIPGSTMLTVQSSGASGSPITIKFESGAMLTAPYWSGSRGAINLNGQSYIVIDGGRNGIIQNTDNGTTLAYQQPSCAIQADGTSNIEIKNLTIANLYVHTSSSDNTLSSAVSVAAVSYDPSSYLTIDNNTIHDCGWCVTGYGGNLSFHDNNFYNYVNAIVVGESGRTYSNVSIFNNHFHDMANWDNTTNAYHKEAIHFWGLSGGSLNGADVYNNLFDGTSGGNLTTLMYVEYSVSNCRIYNNVFVVDSTWPSSGGDGQIYLEVETGAQDSNAIYNNTIVDLSGAVPDLGIRVNGGTNLYIRNNVVLGYASVIDLENVESIANMGNNVYEDTAADHGASNTFILNGSRYTTLSAWQSACGCDSNSLLSKASQINLGPDGQLGSGSVAIGAGENLTSLGIESLDKDKIGVQRPSSGPWDAGAYAYGSSTAGPPPPSGLTATSH